ncbi:MAG: DUF560 domain-containing protein [Betaproteobacteria bacterium]|nr:DUF560 domain-containing protein [Betaproteobacteria bacterium]
MKKSPGKFFLAVCLAFAWISAAIAADDLLVKAKQLMERKDAKAAYELLVPFQSERAGDPDYDYLLGIAALDSGRPGEAVFALERVLAVKPDHPQARAEIARAYFALGERETAKQEFESVKKMDVPPEAAATIQKFLDAIEQLEATERTQVRYYLEATLGYDSNVNSATSSSQIAVPLFGGAIFTLSPTSIELDDTYAAVGGGVSVRHPLSREVALFGGINLNKRVNDTEDRFDTGFWDVNAGVSVTREKNVFTAAFQGSNFYVDNNRFRDAYGVTGQWQHNYDARNQASAFLQYSQLHYPGQDLRDADRYVAGVAYAHAFGGDLAPVIYVGGYVGEEREQAARVPHLGHELIGLRAGGQVRLSEKATVFVNASAERRDYGGPEPFFLVTREDEQLDFRIGANFVPARNWTITPLASFVRNDSNVIINDFKRDVFSLTVRREF